MEIVLEIPIRTPSGNQLSGYHWRKRHRMKRDWYYCLLAAMRTAGVGPQTGAFDLAFERHAARNIDVDNAVAGLKAVIDAMVQAGLLVDDRPEYVRSITVKQAKAAKAAERTVIRMRPCLPPSQSSCPTSAPAPPAQSPA
jgi:hypothetical protein